MYVIAQLLRICLIASHSQLRNLGIVMPNREDIEDVQYQMAYHAEQRDYHELVKAAAKIGADTLWRQFETPEGRKGLRFDYQPDKGNVVKLNSVLHDPKKVAAIAHLYARHSALPPPGRVIHIHDIYPAFDIALGGPGGLETRSSISFTMRDAEDHTVGAYPDKRYKDTRSVELSITVPKDLVERRCKEMGLTFSGQSPYR
jgi:hypothetical protein